jgi:hypothetical protein
LDPNLEALFFLWVVSIYLCSHLPCTFDGWVRILDFYLHGFSCDKTPSLEEPSPAVTAPPRDGGDLCRKKLSYGIIPRSNPNMATNSTTTTLKIITMFKRSKENYSTWREKRVENGVQMAPTNLVHFFLYRPKKNAILGVN